MPDYSVLDQDPEAVLSRQVTSLRGRLKALERERDMASARIDELIHTIMEVEREADRYAEARRAREERQA